MPEIGGVEFNKETGVEFQSWYGQRPSAWLLGAMIRKISDLWLAKLTAVGSSTETIRQAQGALDALGTLDEWCESVKRMNLDKDETTEIDEYELDYAPAGLEESNG